MLAVFLMVHIEEKSSKPFSRESATVVADPDG
jgi:hypothetical protein